MTCALLYCHLKMREATDGMVKDPPGHTETLPGLAALDEVMMLGAMGYSSGPLASCIRGVAGRPQGGGPTQPEGLLVSYRSKTFPPVLVFSIHFDGFLYQ